MEQERLREDTQVKQERLRDEAKQSRYVMLEVPRAHEEL